jgi:pimeloyl-ACP methyl ester carboxylesterase
VGAEMRPRILLLPGAFEVAADLRAAGFAAALAERGIDADLELAELEFSNLTDRSMLERLRAGPIQAARRAGCASVWLAGVSLGGFMAISLAERFAGAVDGLCLIAPYLGTRLTSAAIARAGGLARWVPTADDGDDEDCRLWQFLKSSPPRRPPIYLGFGREDRFADSQRLLAAALPADSVDVVDGRHDRATWRVVWDRFLERFAALPRQRASGSAA